MSSHILKIISKNVMYLPTDTALESALAYLKGIYNESVVSFEITSEVEFIDQGGNFETVSCNLCQKQMEVEFWFEKMNIAFENKFRDLNFTTKCCNKETNLNILNYDGDTGFAKFSISIQSRLQGLSFEQQQALEMILKTDLKWFWCQF